MAEKVKGQPTRKKRGRRGPREADTAAPSYLSILGLGSVDAIKLMGRVERGLPFSALVRFQGEIELPWSRIAELVQIKGRTLTRRKTEGRLQSDESERLLRVARIYQLVVDLFDGDREAARRWLCAPKKALGGALPLDFIRSEIGAREVEHLVGRLEHGVFS